MKIDVTKIPKERIFVGKKGKYLSLTLHDNKNGPDEYGYDGFVSVDVTKEERLAGTRGPIVGNWKHVGQKPRTADPPPSRPASKLPPIDPDLDPVEDGDPPF